jgi:carbamoyl-phosphate synthase large subunit
MSAKPLCIAVTGLNATDNPAPGIGVIRALKLAAVPGDRFIGLAYDALDPGNYAPEIVPDVFLLPYPSQGLQPFLSRLQSIQERVGLDVIIPTLDSELPSFIEAEAELKAMGIATFLPTREQLDLRSKGSLIELGKKASLSVPATAVVASVSELSQVHHQVPYPLFVKGVFYGASLAYSLDEAVGAYHKVVAQWGLPVVVQTKIVGEEFNVVAVGDGEGGLVGCVAMKKLLITDKGKGWAGVTVKDPALVELTTSFMRSTRWRGPCEIELMRDPRGTYYLIEINPRFPAWVYLSATAGVNLAAAVVELCCGSKPAALPDYAAGKMFVRISIDQEASIEDFQRLVTTGELTRSAGEG